jgi:hypothetical protein
MKIKELNQRPGIDKEVRLAGPYLQFEKLLIELRKRDLPDGLVVTINKDIEDLNTIIGSGNELRIIVRKKQTRIIKLLEKEVKLVPKDYYRKLWLAIGMATFGIPIGVVFGSSTGNMGYLGIGLPIGMAIGIAVGTGMDKKAFEEGRQIDLEIKF